MGVRRNKEGPLYHALLVRVGTTDGVTFFDRTQPPDIKPSSIDGDYVVEMADRHDLLAARQLGTPQAGWTIMERNKDIDPEEIDMRLWPNDFVPGRTIKIPPVDNLRSNGVIK